MDYTLVILVTLFGFFLLAALLLVPIYIFLKRQEKEAEMWDEILKAPEHRDQPPGDHSAPGENGAPGRGTARNE